MATIKILIVEDEELYADQLEMLVDKLGYEHLGTVDESSAVLQLIQQEQPDLILMDIHIQGAYDGIELTEMIHQDYTIPIIFITSLKDELTFNRASRTKAVHFIVKPFDDLQLQRAIELTVRRLIEPQAAAREWKEDVLFEEQFFIKTRNRLEKIQLADILFFEADGHYCGLHLTEKRYLLHMSLSHVTALLPKDRFLQTHRSYVVNKSKIQGVDLQDSVLEMEGKAVPLSKRNREFILNELNWIS